MCLAIISTSFSASSSLLLKTQMQLIIFLSLPLVTENFSRQKQAQKRHPAGYHGENQFDVLLS